MTSSDPGIHLFVARLESTCTLSDEERTAVRKLPMRVIALAADQSITREGDRPSRSCLLLEGYTCTYKLTRDGRRQIMAFHMPGDIPDLQSLHLTTLDNSLGTITPCRVGFVPHEALRALCERHPRITSALWRQTLVDAAIFREWMMGIGRREAYVRVAHLLCEFVARMRAVGLVEEQTCDLPMTQNELADALGLTPVHINRTLQVLRGADLIILKGSTLQVLDWAGLQRAGDFDPTYLHQVRT